MDTAALHLLAGWIAIAAGVLAGAVIGLRFHEEDWAGGYTSFRRRMMRLGHIAFFGLGFVNLFFALSLGPLGLEGTGAAVASAGFLVAVVTMPACCFLTAWRRRFRHLFPIPVLATVTGLVPTLLAAVVS